MKASGLFPMVDALILLAVLHKIPPANLIVLGPESSIEERRQ